MARTLKDLIKASGNTGVSGQSFRVHVTGAVTGAKMTDWNISASSYSGHPTELGGPLSGGAYNDATVLSVTNTITRGSRAHNIQRNLLSDYIPVTTSGGGSVLLSAFSSGGTPTGATHAFSATLRGDTVTPTPVYSATGVNAPGSDPNPVLFSISITNGGTAATSQTVNINYAPDGGPYNPTILTTWSYSIMPRTWATTDFDVEWHSNTTYTGLLSTLYEYQASTVPPYPTNPNGLAPNETATAYLRYRRTGTSGAWTNIGAVSYYNPV